MTTPPDPRPPHPGQPDEPARAATSRLELLLSSVRDLGGALELDQVLRRIVEIACTVSGARYGALGVIDEVEPDRLSRFLTVGVTEEEHRAIGDLPRGRGLLGRLISDPHPVRLADLSAAPDSVGFPPHHPPMRTFLGMPVRIGDEVFGNLYLTEKEGGQEFTLEDQHLVEGLSVMAGAAIDAVQQRTAAAVQHEVLRGTWEVQRSLLSQEGQEVSLPLVTDRVLELTGAEAVAVVARDEEDRPAVLAAAGADAAGVLAGLREEMAQALADGERRDLLSPTDRAAVEGTAGRHRSSLVPVEARSGDPTVLVTAGWRPRAGLDERATRELLDSFATQVGLVLDQSRQQADRSQLMLLEERDRIARDLHDLVIQRLFAVGLQLQGASRLAVRAPVIERLQSAVTELDATIRDIRATIFELQFRPGERSLRADLRELAGSYASTLGFAPVVVFHGPVDTAADDETQTQLLAVLREALSNVARHARASSVQVTVTVAGDELVATVADDGVGIPAAVAESGLRNLRSRARARGGLLHIGRREPHGTELTWRVPLPRD